MAYRTKLDNCTISVNKGTAVYVNLDSGSIDVLSHVGSKTDGTYPLLIRNTDTSALTILSYAATGYTSITGWTWMPCLTSGAASDWYMDNYIPDFVEENEYFGEFFFVVFIFLSLSFFVDHFFLSPFFRILESRMS